MQNHQNREILQILMFRIVNLKISSEDSLLEDYFDIRDILTLLASN
jgi:hypothetical protein